MMIATQIGRFVQIGILSLVMVVASACSGATSSQSSGGDPNVITQEQMQEMQSMSNAYSVVQRLHPNWLRKRGPSSVSGQSDIVVYVNGSRYGPPTSLRRIDVIDVESMEFLSDNQATARFGSGHDHGAILVHLKQ